MNWLKRQWLRLWRWFRPAEAPFGTALVDELPDEPSPCTVYIAGEGRHLWCAAFVCPCGCGEIIRLNLLKDARPCWGVEQTPGRDRLDRALGVAAEGVPEPLLPQAGPDRLVPGRRASRHEGRNRVLLPVDERAGVAQNSSQARFRTAWTGSAVDGVASLQPISSTPVRA